MTLDPKLRDLFAAGDEIVAQLDALHAASKARQTDYLAQLRARVANLDAPNLPDEPAADVERPQRDDPRRRQQAPEEPYVALPQRTTEGGPFGPVVREKLRRIALEKSGW